MKFAGTDSSRRNFLKRAMQSCAGVVLMSSLPEWLHARNAPGRAYLERACFAMGTVVTISAYGENKKHVLNATTRAFDEIRRIDRLMSVYQPMSQVSTVNRLASREPVVVDKDLIEIIEDARRFGMLTNGEFDITLEPLMELWGFRDDARGSRRMPTDREIAAAVEAAGIKNVILDVTECTISLLNPQCRIDLGGIAVGYSVDQAVKTLKAEGIESAFINHSGDAYALGHPEHTEGWEIAIPNPLQPQEMIYTLRLRDRAMSTSGNYEKVVSYDQNRYGHIIDPRTGRPASQVLSMSVVSNTSVSADALSTGVFVTGVERGRDLISRHGASDFIAVVEQEGREEIVSTF
jgi:thiamine biosynthesis lipoprotein